MSKGRTNDFHCELSVTIIIVTMFYQDIYIMIMNNTNRNTLVLCISMGGLYKMLKAKEILMVITKLEQYDHIN